MDFLSYYVVLAIPETPLHAETHDSVSATIRSMVGRYLYPPTFAILVQPFLLASPYQVPCSGSV
jgi:hypothetical protein